ncbi:FAD-dependent oxidoreductase [Terrarubrum flagellatum]|uniref:FAD-dependent oxidoreductase n=1 Tax=Terrirubrum flagellatum TaxID=2895980 RepID=UPI0031454CD7
MAESARASRDYDVIVVGAGGAGLAAASAAADAGARILAIDAAPKVGGSTALSGGVFYAAGTSVQRSAGVVDTPDDQFRYYMNANQHKLAPAIVRRLCDEGADTLEWLISLGVRFPESNLYVSGVDGVRRGHRAEGHGAEIAAALEGSLSGKSVDIATSTRVRDLIIDDAGRASGVRIDGQDVSAGAVVIASGGFGANPRLLAELYPDATRHPDLAWYIGSSFCRGDGLEMARAVGADVAAVNKGLLLLTPGFARELETYLPGWVVHVNHEGRRFINESTEYSVLASVLKEQTAGECFAIFDEKSRAASRSTPAPNWAADRLAHFIETGHIARADTLAELADKIGVREETLATTIETYNAGCDRGRDECFFKKPELLQPVRTPPFHAARIRPAIICWTGTGLRIDREARVLTKADRPIAGLFAAGEATGGAFGECYAGGGASIANAIIFGRAAGRNAAAFARMAS